MPYVLRTTGGGPAAAPEPSGGRPHLRLIAVCGGLAAMVLLAGGLLLFRGGGPVRPEPAALPVETTASGAGAIAGNEAPAQSGLSAEQDMLRGEPIDAGDNRDSGEQSQAHR